MKKKYSTKRSFVASLLTLCLTFSMLVGTTFAWFTDTVSSDNNIIQTGTLKVGLHWAKGTEDPTSASWADATKTAIFDSKLWEPGYAEARHIKITNDGTLALKYQMRIIATGVVSELADVIDVYCFAPNAGELNGAVKLENDDALSPSSEKYLGTLSEVLNTADANFISKVVTGNLTAGNAATFTLVLKMKESAGNEYQNLSIGSDFAVQIIATQYTSEKDSFDENYDKDADFAPQETPAAYVSTLTGDELDVNFTIGIGGTVSSATLVTGYQFEPTETPEQGAASPYADWHADYIVSSDAVIPAGSAGLAGYYSFFCDGWNGGNWVALVDDSNPVPANQDIRLLQMMLNGTNVPYSAICEFGNDGIGFRCGVLELMDGVNDGTTITVTLRIFETYPYNHEPHTLADGSTCSGASANCETGHYIDLGTISYTFGGEYVTLDDGSEVFLDEDGDVVLTDVSNVTATEYHVPAGVTAMNGGVFAGNSDIKTVVIPDTVTDFGATGVSATGASSGAFKDSAVETVVLPEGMTEIPAAAFNGAKNLKSVNIPASVETIGVNAFRLTAITELTVPATVENISTGAFRDMTALTTVKVEGNVNFENYAFRSVPNLTSVYLLGDDVTINGSQFAIHSDNGDANGITIYVKNATVAARVYAAQGSAYGYEVKVLGAAADGSDAGEVVQATSNAALADAITNGDTTIVLGSGEYTMPDTAKGKDITIAGNGSTTVKVVDSGAAEGDIDYSLEGANVTFENVTIKMQGSNYPGYARIASATYNNCTFEGANYCLYGDSVFNGCTFNLTNGYVWTWGAANVEFNGCTFEAADGSAKAILVHNTTETTVKVKDCKFIATTGKTTWDGIPVAAVSIDPENGSPDATVYFEGTNTYSDAFHGLYQVKYNDEVDDVKVYVNNELVVVPVGENDK